MGKNNQAKRKAKKRLKLAKERRRKLPIVRQNVRPCDGCTACCSVFGVHAIDKQPFTDCEHAVEGGCGIYETRPAKCKEFYCLWQSEVVPLMAKPDKIGVIFAPTNGKTEFTGQHELQAYEVWEGAFDTAAAVEAARILIRNGRLIIGHTYGGKKFRFMGPDSKIAKARSWVERNRGEQA